LAVSQRDLRQIVRFLHHAAEAPNGDAFACEILAELGELIPADVVEYFDMRLSDLFAYAYTVSRPEDQRPDLLAAFEAYRSQNPLGAQHWTPDDGAVRLSGDVPARHVRSLEWYHEYLAPNRIRDQLKLWLARTPDSAVCISLNRSDGVFSDRDAAVLDVLQPHLLALHRAALEGDSTARAEPLLTRREAQVLSCLVSGRDNKAIAELLFISPGTVRKHLEHAYEKLGVRNRSEATTVLMRIAPMRTRR
jgi:DNA-binding CsgD family transcriptional regulator